MLLTVLTILLNLYVRFRRSFKLYSKNKGSFKRQKLYNLQRIFSFQKIEFCQKCTFRPVLQHCVVQHEKPTQSCIFFEYFEGHSQFTMNLGKIVNFKKNNSIFPPINFESTYCTYGIQTRIHLQLNFNFYNHKNFVKLLK